MTTTVGRAGDARSPLAPTFPSRAGWPEVGIFQSSHGADYLEQAAAARPDALAVIDGASRYRYRDLLDEVVRVAAGLASLGVGPGHVVTMQLPNWWEAAVVVHAVARLGAVINPVVPIYRDHEVGFIVRQARPTAIVVAETFRGFDYLGMLHRVLADMAGPPAVVVVRPSGPLPARFSAFEQLGGTGADPGPVGRPEDIALLLYTSGTTADPKGVLHSHQTLGYEVRSFIDLFALGASDTVFMPSPVTHITGFLFGLLLPPMTGASVALLDVWDPAVALEVIEAESCRFVMGATPFLHGLVGEYRRQARSSSLETFLCGGADVPPALIRTATEVLGGHVARVYGSTEFPTLCCGQPGDTLEVCADTDGTPVGPVDYRLEGASGGVGELVVDGPERFLGYLDASLNEAAFTDDGFFRTGDLATISSSGAVTITGRSKDIIIRGGENISAKEVEDLLFGHPGVAEVAIVAMPDPVMVERACAFVVPTPGAKATLVELVEHLEGLGLARQKLPERLEVVDALPVTASGKVQKYILRERVATLLRQSRPQ